MSVELLAVLLVLEVPLILGCVHLYLRRRNRAS